MSELSRRTLQVVDAVFYAVAVTGVAFAVGTVLSFALGSGWVGVKTLLFVVGILAAGLASLQLRPTPAWRDERRFSLEPDEETPFQARIQEVPPLRDHDLEPDQRLSTSARLFLGALLMLVVSFSMEVVFGVGVPPTPAPAAGPGSAVPTATPNATSTPAAVAAVVFGAVVP